MKLSFDAKSLLFPALAATPYPAAWTELREGALDPRRPLLLPGTVRSTAAMRATRRRCPLTSTGSSRASRRALLVEGFDEDWFDTKGEYLACRAASPAWELLGLPGPLSVGWSDGGPFRSEAMAVREAP